MSKTWVSGATRVFCCRDFEHADDANAIKHKEEALWLLQSLTIEVSGVDMFQQFHRLLSDLSTFARLCCTPRWARAVPILAWLTVGCACVCLHILCLGRFGSDRSHGPWISQPVWSILIHHFKPRPSNMPPGCRDNIFHVLEGQKSGKIGKAWKSMEKHGKAWNSAKTAYFKILPRWLLWRLCRRAPLWSLQDAFLLFRRLPTRRVEIPQGGMSKS